MNKISKSAILAVFFIVSIMVIIYFTSGSYVFAIEYNTYTSKTFGIEFQYSSDWKIDSIDEDKGVIIIEDPNDSSKEIAIYKDLFHEGKGEHDLQSFTDENLALLKELSFKIIQKPVLISTENLEMQTFLTTNEDNNEIKAVQHWTFIGNGHEYVIRFFSPVSKFNSPVNTEILDPFIKSIKIISANKNP